MNEKWTQSRALLERARKSLAGGVSSPFRAKAPVPLFFADGKGARLTDVDGNEYIDYQLAWGPMILGYSHPAMVAALQDQAAKPLSYGAQHELEFQVSEKIQSMVPCAERVAFTSSGSETVQLAQRLARACTGRQKILKFEGHYHGWMDGALHSYKPSADQTGPLDEPRTVPGSKGQVENAAENVVVAPWNRLDVLEHILDAHPNEIAAIFMEPVLCNSGCLLPGPGYLEKVQELARKHGCLLVFDEVITGFRMNPGGAQTHFGITPDLATFGKAVGGGVPLSVVAGRTAIMEQMFHAGVAFGGTFNGNPFSLRGAAVCLEELSKDEGAALKHANQMGDTLKEAMSEIIHRRGIQAQVTGFGTAFCLHFTKLGEFKDYRDTLTDDKDQLQRFLLAALSEGVNIVPDGRFYVSTAHTETDIAETIERLDRAFSQFSA